MADNLTPEVLQREYTIEELNKMLDEQDAREQFAIKNQLAGMDADPLPVNVPEDDGLLNNTYEVFGSAVEQGAEQIVRTLGDLSAAPAESIEDYFDPEGESSLFGRFVLGDDTVPGLDERGLGVPFTDFRIAYMNRKDFEQMSLLYEIETGKATRSLSNVDLPDVDRPDSTAGQVTSDIIRWAMVFAATRKSLGAAGGRATQITKGVAAGIAADFAAFDPHEARLSDLLITIGDGNPVFQNALTEYLAVEQLDSNLEGRMKNAVEGAVVGGLVETVFRSIKWLRARRIERAGRETSETTRPVPGQKVANEVQPEGTPEVTPEDALQARLDEIEVKAQERAAAREQAASRAESVVENTARNLDARETSITPEQRSQMSAALKEGRLSEAEDLISFNSDTFDWEGIGAKLDSAEDADVVRQIINTTSEVFSRNMDEAQGYQSLAHTLAKSVGSSVDDLRSLHLDVTGGKGIAARMAGARALLTASADRLRILGQAAARDGATTADEIALFRHIELHAAIQAQVKGSGSEIARALHAMRTMKAATADSIREFDKVVREIGGRNPEIRKQLAEKYASVTDLNQVHSLVKKSRWRRAADVGVEVYINGLLSSLSTLTLNNTSNLLKIVEGFTERYFSVAVGGLRNGVRRGLGMEPLERVALREANAFAVGTMKGLETAIGIPIRETLRAGGRSLAAIARADIEAAGISWREAVEGLKGAKEGTVVRALIDEQPQTDVLQRVDTDTRKAINATGDGLDARAIRALGKFIRIPSRLILTSDEFFKTIGFHQELYARAYRNAAAVADEAGATGARREEIMAKQMEVDINNPPEDLHYEAMDFARYQTFQAELEGSFARDIEDILNRNPVMKFVIPFYRTPVNIVKQTILERSPLGFTKLHHSKLWKQIAKGGPEGDIALARLATGSAFIGMGMQWAMDGRITGSGSSAAGNRNTETLDGIPPYSIKIGDTWYQYNRLEPLGMLMGLSADLAEAAMSWDPENDDRDFWEATVVAITVVTTNITDKTWFKGVADLVAAVDDPKRYIENYAENLGSTIVLPYNSLLRRINVEHDQYAREAWTFFDKWRRNIPGLSDDLPLARDYLGNPREKPDYVGQAWLSPFMKGIESNDPVYTELARLGFDYRMPNKDVFRIGQDVTPEQYSEFLRLRGQSPIQGQTLQQALADLFRSPEYKFELTDAGREEVIKSMVGRYGQAARAEMLNRDFSLQLRYREAKRQAKDELLAIP
ncbi:MAG: hypothetical protein AAGA44_12120 [Pseudomonadota bacterium]